MGVIYKLKQEIKNYILEQKRANPNLSCRGLGTLVEEKFQIKVSKSSINSIIKGTGLSMPVGRRLKKRRYRLKIQTQPLLEMKTPTLIEKLPEAYIEKIAEVKVEERIEKPIEIECTGAILLKAADYLIGGAHFITETIKSHLNQPDSELLAKTESLIYMPLFELSQDTADTTLVQLWSLIDKKIPLENINSYLNELQAAKTIIPDILRIITAILQEVRCVKVNFSDGGTLYLDGQLYTIWSTPHIPYDFSIPINHMKNQINKYFYKDMPLVLSMAPGYDIPTKEFFDFLLSFDYTKKKITRLTLYGNRFEELESIAFEQTRKRFFIFGFWPWQFVEYRKVIKIGEFMPFHFEMLKKEFYLAELEIELSEPVTKQSIILKGCALKTAPAEKIRLVILSNLSTKPEEVANIYLSHWPNLEETFQDASRKIELFTYTASSQRFFSTQNLNLDKGQDIKTLFYNYLRVIDSYVKWHFLPSGYEDKDFSIMKENFYGLKATLKRQKDYALATFQVPEAYRFLKELQYACRRLNEKEIVFGDRRPWFFL